MCSRVEASRNMQGREGSKFANWSMDADMQAIRAAAHCSSLSTLFSLMQLAIMKAEATVSPLPERTICSVGFVPLSSSI